MNFQHANLNHDQGIKIAFQAIANVHSGQCFGYEVLTHRQTARPASSSSKNFDLDDLGLRSSEQEIAVREKVAQHLGASSSIADKALFLDLDHCAYAPWDAVMKATRTTLGALAGQVVTKISKLPAPAQTASDWIRSLRSQGGMIAIDRVGAVADFLVMLRICEADFVKIDRTLLTGIDGDRRNQVMVSHLVSMSRALGIRVIADGISSSRELQVVRELGFDFVSGLFIDPPGPVATLVEGGFAQIRALASVNRRQRQIDEKWVLQQLEVLPSICVNTPIAQVFDHISTMTDQSVIPVNDNLGHPLGILDERKLKNFAYSSFGKDLIANKGFRRTLHDYLLRCPVADQTTPLDQMLAIYSAAVNADGILVTQNMTYCGFLSARSIILAIHEKTVARAHDVNPLTKLPGNAVISDYIQERGNSDKPTVLAYVDFDNFKPFNDLYGFRLGDRAILLFAELLHKLAGSEHWFIGHIGGDDFFLGMPEQRLDAARDRIAGLIRRFSQDTLSFYDEEARNRGYITATDRDGTVRNFPLLSASAVIFRMDADSGLSADHVSTAIARKKREAKTSPDKIAVAVLTAFDSSPSPNSDERNGEFLKTGSRFNDSGGKKAKDYIDDLALIDQLTGLPNRTLLIDRLTQCMVASQRSDSHGALLFIDLDNFKALNDSLGHDVGDLLLKQVAQRLTRLLRIGDTVARFGGDEFVLVLPGLDRAETDAASHVEAISGKILAALNQPYQLGEASYRCTPSVGVTLFKGQTAPHVLLKQADLAMYKSKAAGRNTIRFFDPAMESAVKERVSLEADLREALKHKEFTLFYQPQIIAPNTVNGVEALLRWSHPKRGMVSPAEFIPFAEESGLILPIGQWVLESACRQLAAWAPRPEFAHLTIAVNVSASQFHQGDFVEQVLATIAGTGADPCKLKLELTESLLVENVQDIVEKMFALKARGVGFSLDDFGTGYSSLSYLKRLPFENIKVDQSFVRDVLTDSSDAAIIKTIVALAKSLGLGIIAEGVETKQQMDVLTALGCQSYQGYYFSQPLTKVDFEEFIVNS